MIKPGVKGRCLTCPYFKCESETAWIAIKIVEMKTGKITQKEKLRKRSLSNRKNYKDHNEKKSLAQLGRAHVYT